MDGRNIEDRYWGWTNDLIKKRLMETAFPYAALMEHIQGDFNIGQMIRCANAFNAKEVFYVGQKHFNKKGAVGTYNYTNINYLKDYDEVKKLREKYNHFIGIENHIEKSTPLELYQWKPNSLLIFGEESCGLTEEMKSLCDEFVTITQYGSVRSLNVGCTSGIVFNDFVTKLNRNR